jgi:RNA polymerase sigma-70 factor (ECF subfamily)
VENHIVQKTIDHLFRHESGRLISLLTRVFGTHNLDLVEDVVQDTLLKALEYWKFKGIPDNPSAWILKVAKNKALDVLRRERLKNDFADDLNRQVQSEYSLVSTLNQLFQSETIEDEQLRMMFVCCHPQIATEAQVALILKNLCGFSVAEIAKAFISNEETIGKRLYRAKQAFREQKIKFEIPSANELKERLENVLTAIYLLFNEGYNSTHHNLLIRNDLINEALRLAKMLFDNPLTQQSEVAALLALMCFHAARIPARADTQGNIQLLQAQNRSLWNRELIKIGFEYIDKALDSQELTVYHLEAGIAYEHCVALSYEQTNWSHILHLYNLLYQVQPNPIVALNRAIVIGELEGAEAAIQAIRGISNLKSLENYYLLAATLGEFYLKIGDKRQAKTYFAKALQLTQAPAEKILLQGKLEELND